MNDSMTIEIDLKAFENNYRDAKEYHQRTEQFVKEGQRPSLTFNIATVALEKYLIALCELYGEMPFNHNYTCLMDSVENVVDLPFDLNRDISSLDDIFGICSIDDYHHRKPNPSDSVRVLSMCSGVEKLFDQSRIASIRAAAENKFKNNIGAH